MPHIYKITNPKGNIYIGQTTGWVKRLSAYKNLNCKAQKKIYNSLLKYGIDAHTFELIHECELAELNKWERHYQDLFNSVGRNGLNLRATKENDKSGYFSQESRERMSKSWNCNQQRKKVLNENRYDWTGRKHRVETIEKMRFSALGKKKTAEHIAKLPQNQKGKFRPKNRPETTLKQINGSTIKKVVYQYSMGMEFIAEHISTNQAAKAIGVKRGGNIRSCACGKLCTAYGFVWRYEKV